MENADQFGASRTRGHTAKLVIAQKRRSGRGSNEPSGLVRDQFSALARPELYRQRCAANQPGVIPEDPRCMVKITDTGSEPSTHGIRRFRKRYAVALFAVPRRAPAEAALAELRAAGFPSILALGGRWGLHLRLWGFLFAGFHFARLQTAHLAGE